MILTVDYYTIIADSVLRPLLRRRIPSSLIKTESQEENSLVKTGKRTFGTDLWPIARRREVISDTSHVRHPSRIDEHRPGLVREGPLAVVSSAASRDNAHPGPLKRYIVRSNLAHLRRKLGRVGGGGMKKVTV